MAAAYSLAMVVAGHEAALAVIVAGASDPAMHIYDAADTLLASFVLNPATSAVAPLTGVMTLDISTQESSAPATGTASYAEIVDGDGDPHLRLDCVEGTEALSGYCVITSAAITEGTPVAALSIGMAAPAMIGA